MTYLLTCQLLKGNIKGKMESENKPNIHSTVSSVSHRFTFACRLGSWTIQRVFDPVPIQMPISWRSQHLSGGWCRSNHIQMERKQQVNRFLECSPTANKSAIHSDILWRISRHVIWYLSIIIYISVCIYTFDLAFYLTFYLAFYLTFYLRCQMVCQNTCQIAR